MEMETGRLYGSGELLPGKIVEFLPSEYISTRVAQGAINFGRGIVRGSAGGQVKLPASGSDSFVGIAGYSFEAADMDDEAYADKDPVACVESGIVMARVEEAVSEGDPVRMRHSQEAGTKGYQSWGFSAAKNGSSATGLADDATKSSATGDQNLSSGHDWSSTEAKNFVIEVNQGEPVQIALDAACISLAEVLTLLNAKFLTAGIDDLVEAVASTNFVKLQTKSAGADQSIEVAEGDGALAQLGIDADTYEGTDGTTYSAAVKINGVEQAVEVAGYKAQTIATLVSEIDGQLTGAAATFVDATDKIKIESDTVGDGSTVEIVDDDLFASLTDINEDPDAAVDGSGNPDETNEPGMFRTSEIAGKTMLITGAEFKGSTTGAGLVPIKLTGQFSVTADI